MSTITQITKKAEKAINSALKHYFVNMASGQERIEEAKFIAEVLRMIQGWIFFTEDALHELDNYMTKDTLYTNLSYTLTTLFRTRLCFDHEKDESDYHLHLAKAFAFHEIASPEMTFIPEQYRSRMFDSKTILDVLKNNPTVVMFVTLFLYIDTTLLMRAVSENNG